MTQQLSLTMFDDSCQILNLAPCDGELSLIKQFYPLQRSDALFAQLKTDIVWQEEELLMYGKLCKVPRLMAWYGDPRANYQYSGVDHVPLPWTAQLLAVRDKVAQYCSSDFNSVLLNLYRNGQDSMGCHCDDEQELGNNPVIASLSLGDARVFKLHHKTRKITLDVVLEHGDLLVMAGTLQRYWQHAVPKTRQHKTARINLTFRMIY
jgi:alkylated DNA repair dioxygenase AlkB